MTHEKFEGETHADADSHRRIRQMARKITARSDRGLLRRGGFSGATVLRGVGGYGGTSTYHTEQNSRLSQDLPIVVEVVEATEKIEAMLPRLDE